MTVKELIEMCDLVIASDGINLYARNTYQAKKNLEEIKARKHEIIALLKAEKEAEENARIEREAKIAAIEGLEEIRKARAEWEDYNYKFNKAMERGDCRFPSKPASDVESLKKQYPRAAAYLKAESYSRASNYMKVAAGRKALERITNGEDHEVVIADMEAEWSNAAREAAMWN